MQSNQWTKLVGVGAMLITLASLGGCDTYGPTATERDYGNSVRSMVSNQTANPAPADPESVADGDGVRSDNALGVYREDVTQPGSTKREAVIGGDNR
jgi:hypothetical protein